MNNEQIKLNFEQIRNDYRKQMNRLYDQEDVSCERVHELSNKKVERLLKNKSDEFKRGFEAGYAHVNRLWADINQVEEQIELRRSRIKEPELQYLLKVISPYIKASHKSSSDATSHDSDAVPATCNTNNALETPTLVAVERS